MDLVSWSAGTLVVGYTLAIVGQAAVDSRRDTLSPYRRAPIPDAGPDAWRFRGTCRTSVWGWWPGARMIVTRDWIGVSTLGLAGRQTFVAARADVDSVAVVTGPPLVLVAGIGLVGEARCGVVVSGPTRRDVEAELARLGWPFVRRRGGFLRPFGRRPLD